MTNKTQIESEIDTLESAETDPRKFRWQSFLFSSILRMNELYYLWENAR